jgi:hypothetical protein
VTLPPSSFGYCGGAGDNRRFGSFPKAAIGNSWCWFLVLSVKKHAEVQLENVVETVDKKTFVQSNRFNDAV